MNTKQGSPLCRLLFCVASLSLRVSLLLAQTTQHDNNRVTDAVTKAKEEWHHYTHCLELVGCVAW